LADVIIFNLDDNANKYREEIANILRNSNLRVDHYLKSEKIDKQFKYAENKNIPFGIFAGEKEEKS
jgi:histidyl-tRNA synthetase